MPHVWRQAFPGVGMSLSSLFTVLCLLPTIALAQSGGTFKMNVTVPADTNGGSGCVVLAQIATLTAPDTITAMKPVCPRSAPNPPPRGGETVQWPLSTDGDGAGSSLAIYGQIPVGDGRTHPRCVMVLSQMQVAYLLGRELQFNNNLDQIWDFTGSGFLLDPESWSTMACHANDPYLPNDLSIPGPIANKGDAAVWMQPITVAGMGQGADVDRPTASTVRQPESLSQSASPSTTSFRFVGASNTTSSSGAASRNPEASAPVTSSVSEADQIATSEGASSDEQQSDPVRSLSASTSSIYRSEPPPTQSENPAPSSVGPVSASTNVGPATSGIEEVTSTRESSTIRAATGDAEQTGSTRSGRTSRPPSERMSATTTSRTKANPLESEGAVDTEDTSAALTTSRGAGIPGSSANSAVTGSAATSPVEGSSNVTASPSPGTTDVTMSLPTHVSERLPTSSANAPDESAVTTGNEDATLSFGIATTSQDSSRNSAMSDARTKVPPTGLEPESDESAIPMTRQSQSGLATSDSFATSVMSTARSSRQSGVPSEVKTSSTAEATSQAVSASRAKTPPTGLETDIPASSEHPSTAYPMTSSETSSPANSTTDESAASAMASGNTTASSSSFNSNRSDASTRATSSGRSSRPVMTDSVSSHPAASLPSISVSVTFSYGFSGSSSGEAGPSTRSSSGTASRGSPTMNSQSRPSTAPTGHSTAPTRLATGDRSSVAGVSSSTYQSASTGNLTTAATSVHSAINASSMPSSHLESSAHSSTARGSSTIARVQPSTGFPDLGAPRFSTTGGQSTQAGRPIFITSGGSTGIQPFESTAIAVTAPSAQASTNASSVIASTIENLTIESPSPSGGLNTLGVEASPSSEAQTTVMPSVVLDTTASRTKIPPTGLESEGAPDNGQPSTTATESRSDEGTSLASIATWNKVAPTGLEDDTGSQPTDAPSVGAAAASAATDNGQASPVCCEDQAQAPQVERDLTTIYRTATVTCVPCPRTSARNTQVSDSAVTSAIATVGPFRVTASSAPASISGSSAPLASLGDVAFSSNGNVDGRLSVALPSPSDNRRPSPDADRGAQDGERARPSGANAGFAATVNGESNQDSDDAGDESNDDEDVLEAPVDNIAAMMDRLANTLQESAAARLGRRQGFARGGGGGGRGGMGGWGGGGGDWGGGYEGGYTAPSAEEPAAQDTPVADAAEATESEAPVEEAPPSEDTAASDTGNTESTGGTVEVEASQASREFAAVETSSGFEELASSYASEATAGTPGVNLAASADWTSWTRFPTAAATGYTSLASQGGSNSASGKDAEPTQERGSSSRYTSASMVEESTARLTGSTARPDASAPSDRTSFRTTESESGSVPSGTRSSGSDSAVAVTRSSFQSSQIRTAETDAASTASSRDTGASREASRTSGPEAATTHSTYPPTVARPTAQAISTNDEQSSQPSAGGIGTAFSTVISGALAGTSDGSLTGHTSEATSASGSDATFSSATSVQSTFRTSMGWSASTGVTASDASTMPGEMASSQSTIIPFTTVQATRTEIAMSSTRSPTSLASGTSEATLATSSRPFTTAVPVPSTTASSSASSAPSSSPPSFTRPTTSSSPSFTSTFPATSFPPSSYLPTSSFQPTTSSATSSTFSSSPSEGSSIFSSQSSPSTSVWSASTTEQPWSTFSEAEQSTVWSEPSPTDEWSSTAFTQPTTSEWSSPTEQAAPTSSSPVFSDVGSVIQQFTSAMPAPSASSEGDGKDDGDGENDVTVIGQFTPSGDIPGLEGAQTTVQLNAMALLGLGSQTTASMESVETAAASDVAARRVAEAVVHLVEATASPGKLIRRSRSRSRRSRR